MKTVLLTLITLFLIGCGGGSSSEPTTPSSDDIGSTPITGDIADEAQEE